MGHHPSRGPGAAEAHRSQEVCCQSPAKPYHPLAGGPNRKNCRCLSTGTLHGQLRGVREKEVARFLLSASCLTTQGYLPSTKVASGSSFEGVGAKITRAIAIWSFVSSKVSDMVCPSSIGICKQGMGALGCKVTTYRNKSDKLARKRLSGGKVPGS